MPAHLLLISKRPEDETLARFIAVGNGFPLNRLIRPADVSNFLIDHPQSIVFWDAQDPEKTPEIAEALANTISPFKVFVCTDGGLNEYPHLFNHSVFGHHLFRRYHDPAPSLLSKLIAASLTPYPFGLQRFFPRGTPSQKIRVMRSGQKNAAVEALRNFLLKKALITRLATLAAQATDELVMNAIFDAPALPDGSPFRRGLSRDADFELKEEGGVEIEVATTGTYTGIAVGDPYGSFKKSELMKYLAKNFQQNAYEVRTTDPGAGLGINGIMQAGMSMAFIAKPGIRTEVIVFFPNSANYKIFRSNAFRFISILGE